MTNNRTTELREKLDKRGIVWMDVYRPTIFRTCWKTGDADVYCYFDEDKLTGLFELHISGYDFTPEQAIAATLGEKPRDRTEERLLKACNQATQDYVAQLEQERDELKSKLEAATLGSEPPKKCSTCQYRYCVGQRPYPTFGYMCGFGDGKKLCGSNTSVLNHMGCEHWEKELE